MKTRIYAAPAVKGLTYIGDSRASDFHLNLENLLIMFLFSYQNVYLYMLLNIFYSRVIHIFRQTLYLKSCESIRHQQRGKCKSRKNRLLFQSRNIPSKSRIREVIINIIHNVFSAIMGRRLGWNLIASNRKYCIPEYILFVTKTTTTTTTTTTILGFCMRKPCYELKRIYRSSLFKKKKKISSFLLKHK